MDTAPAPSPADAGAGGAPENGIFSSENKRDPAGAAADGGTDEEQRERAALAYLLRYEAMVRQQDAEDMATSAHLSPIWGRLAELTGVVAEASAEERPLTGAAALNRRALGRALLRLEAQGAASDAGGGGAEAMTTDLQHMFLLRTLVGDDAGGGSGGGGGEGPALAGREWRTGGGDGDGKGAELTFAEFSYAYKLVVGGMQCLQMLPPGQDPAAAELRGRVTDRTTAMLRSFYEDGGVAAAATDGSERENAAVQAKSPAAASSSKAHKADDDTATTADFDDGKGGGDEMRRLLTVKDRQLVRILDDHFDEMDDVAGRIADDAQADRRRGRKRAALAAAGAAAALLLSWGGAKITTGRAPAAAEPVGEEAVMQAPRVSKNERRAARKPAEEVEENQMDSGNESEEVTSSQPVKNLQNSLAESILKAQVQDAVATKVKNPTSNDDGAEEEQRDAEEKVQKQDAGEESRLEAEEARTAAERKRQARSQHGAKVGTSSIARPQLSATVSSNPRALLVDSASVDVGAALPGLRRFLEVDPTLPDKVRRRKIETRRYVVAGVAGTGAALLLPVLGGALAPLVVGLMGFGWIRTLLSIGGRREAED